MITPQFVAAGQAVFTATNTKRNTRLTFRIERPEQFRGEFFGQVMKGSDNEGDYTYVGMVKEGTLFLRETKGSKFHKGSPEFDGLKLVLDIVAGRRPETPLIEIEGSGNCGKCGKRLTVPEHIKAGIGPECAEKLGLSVAKVTKVAKGTRLPRTKDDSDVVIIPPITVTTTVSDRGPLVEPVWTPVPCTNRTLLDLVKELLPPDPGPPPDDDGDPALKETVGF